jgi:Xaa-Pro aminopeptidase
MELITDFKKIEDEIGLNLPKQTLFGTGCYDAPRDVSVVLVKDKDQGYYLLAQQIEDGNFSPEGCAREVVEKSKTEVIYYRSYFTWEKIDENRALAPDEGTALTKILPEGSTLETEADIPLDRYRKFAAKFDLKLRDWNEAEELVLYEIKKDDVIRRFSQGRSEVQEAAAKLIESLTSNTEENKDLINKTMTESRDIRFERLDELMKEKNISAVLATSQLNIQELTAIGYDSIKEGMLALYDGEKIFVLSPEKINVPYAKSLGSENDLNKALSGLIGQAALGIEEKHIPVGRYNYLELERKDFGNSLRLWRERQGGVNLPYFIIAAQAAKYSMENSLQFLDQQIKSGAVITEKDLEAKIESSFQEFREKYHLPVELRRSHVCIHAGARTPYPALPSDFRLDSSCLSLKIDCGVLVFKNDLFHASSDMARTILFSEEAEEMHELLERSMLEIAIPACKDGVTGADVHQAGMRLLLEKVPRILELGMMPEGRKIEEVYTRNIGHLMGSKQQPTIIFFTPAHRDFVAEAGMIGSVEYQWPYAGYSIGCEDMFLVTRTHGVNIAR